VPDKANRRRNLRTATGSVLVAAFLLAAAPAGSEPFRARDRSDKRHTAESNRARPFKVIRGTSPVSGPGPRKRFIVEIEKRMDKGGRAFAEEVEKILYNDRSWGGNGRIGMRKVDEGPVTFRVTLARPRTVDRYCAPLPTNGMYSCWNGSRAMINAMRWRRGAASYNWAEQLKRYRRYLINHEVGHALGHSHRSCPRRGVKAPVMMQQTKGVYPCKRNAWPRRFERGPAPD
jgi:Protein of unknown function (DUF3152)